MSAFSLMTPMTSENPKGRSSGNSQAPMASAKTLMHFISNYLFGLAVFCILLRFVQFLPAVLLLFLFATIFYGAHTNIKDYFSISLFRGFENKYAVANSIGKNGVIRVAKRQKLSVNSGANIKNILKNISLWTK